ncbi:LPS export ABC transporter permease LptG [Alysiella crassa]|uniref:Lipopolysaccharide export system permease protein lptG n=1 Tax=Alysiella crassa TaxID=153491 RepID=A0A376BKY3_9NEIS|nr:LPS export ABC transporter permease LptG [Alysiella crassa]UOP07473.1 LPS export ABC transporter permease LptG [Alysiella crassa]SSY70336.1 Lipopolysaccharide export system permease protein lptG [Alysiella crassa]
MKLITKYLITRLATMSGYALLSILALYSFIDLLAEVGNIGEGSYTGWTAFQYIIMQMPARAYQLMPLATLIGGLLALSQLSSNSELAVIKTSGLSTANIIGIILKFSAIFAVLTILLGELLAPELSRRADTLKASAKSGSLTASATGVWLKQADSMVNIAAMLPDNTLTGIKIWRYNPDFQLTEIIAAESAQVSDNKWILHNTRSSQIGEKQVHTQHAAQMDWQTNVNKDLLTVLRVKPEQMSFTALTRYIDYLKKNNQDTKAYDVAWWNKLVYPITTMVMSLVALAFTPNSGRHSNMGLKLFGGICLGLLFFFTGRLFGFTTQLYGVPAFFSAVLPTAAFAAWAAYLIRKQEAR